MKALINNDPFKHKTISKESWEFLFGIAAKFPKKYRINKEKIIAENYELLQKNHDLWIVFFSGLSVFDISLLIKEQFGKELKFNFNFQINPEEAVELKERILETREDPGYYLLDMSGKYAMLKPKEQEKHFPKEMKRASLALALEAMESVNHANNLIYKVEHKQSKHLHLVPFEKYILGVGMVKGNTINIQIWKSEDYQERMNGVVLTAKKI